MKVIIEEYRDGEERQLDDVVIDNYDVWNLDVSLAKVIYPALVKLSTKKHGAPSVDDEDTPAYISSINAPPKKFEFDIDDNHFKRWDWVLDEMIWTFKQIAYSSSLFHSDEDEVRINNGLRLFGKYYRSLWS